MLLSFLPVVMSLKGIHLSFLKTYCYLTQNMVYITLLYINFMLHFMTNHTKRSKISKFIVNWLTSFSFHFFSNLNAYYQQNYFVWNFLCKQDTINPLYANGYICSPHTFWPFLSIWIAFKLLYLHNINS